MADQANSLQGGLAIHKMFQALPNEDSTGATMRKCTIRMTVNPIKHSIRYFSVSSQYFGLLGHHRVDQVCNIMASYMEIGISAPYHYIVMLST
jgi:VanZ family protein